MTDFESLDHAAALLDDPRFFFSPLSEAYSIGWRKWLGQLRWKAARQPPQLYGVSGSPVIFFHRYLNEMDLLTILVPKLVGFAIEVHAKKKAVVVSRFALLLAALNRHFNGPEDPASPDTVTVQLP